MRRAGMMVFWALMAVPLTAQHRPWCGTPSPPPQQAEWFQRFLGDATRTSIRQKAPIRIPVAFHVVTDGKKGKLTPAHAQVLIDNLNWAFRDTSFTFVLSSFDTTKNKKWYNNCVFSAANQSKLRKRLAKDVRYYVNVYSCRLGQPGVYGMATFPPGYPLPGNPGTTFMQGIAIDPITVGGDPMFEYGLVLAHEVGHYLGLFHTFERYFNPGFAECADPGDRIPDTPAQGSHTLGSCPLGRDSCPAMPGLDPISNLMNYATDACWQSFTPNQAQLMLEALPLTRPTLGTR